MLLLLIYWGLTLKSRREELWSLSLTGYEQTRLSILLRIGRLLLRILLLLRDRVECLGVVGLLDLSGRVLSATG